MRHFNHFPKEAFTYDLHVLSIPPTFVLSQDQTLQLYNCIVLILFVSLLVCFPQTFINLLLFSFQRPGVASSVAVVTGEREYRQGDSLSIIFLLLVAFSFLRLAGPFLIGALQTKGVYTELKRMSQAPFFFFFHYVSFLQPGAKVNYF